MSYTYRHVPLRPEEAEEFGRTAAGELAARLSRCKEPDERERKIIEMAQNEYHRDGEIEIDEAAAVSEGDDNGAYVLAWVWVSFADTDLDKDPA